MLILHFFFILFITAEHLENLSNIFSTQDPAFVIVCAAHPDDPLTVFNLHQKGATHYSVGLSPISLDALPYQIFHFYYNAHTKLVTFRLESDKKVTLDSQINVFQATRGPIDEHLHIVAVSGTSFIKIINENNCLTAENGKNLARDAYLLKFKSCDASDKNQLFSLAPKMIALCRLDDPACPGKRDILDAARDIMLKKIVEASVAISELE